MITFFGKEAIWSKPQQMSLQQIANIEIIFLIKLTELFEMSGTNRRMYGFFHCKKCNSHWESAFVYVKQKDGNKMVSIIATRTTDVGA